MVNGNPSQSIVRPRSVYNVTFQTCVIYITLMYLMCLVYNDISKQVLQRQLDEY